MSSLELEELVVLRSVCSCGVACRVTSVVVCPPALASSLGGSVQIGEDPPSCGVCFILVKVLVVHLNGNIVIRASHVGGGTRRRIRCGI